MKSSLAPLLLLVSILTATGIAQDAGAGGQLHRQITAANYPEGSSVKLALAPTARMAEALGQASVRRRRGVTEFDVSVEEVQPAILFGGDFNTYVVWVISPQGVAYNAGELVLQGAKGKLKATTPLAAFGLMITAEPHFLAQKPSTFGIMVSTDSGLASQKGVTQEVFDFSDFATGYKAEKEALAGPAEAKGRMRSDRHQAMVAVRFAEESGAQEWAGEVFTQARAALSATLQAFAQGVEEKDLTIAAHRAVRLAVQAKKLAEERRAAAMLADERKTNRETIERLQQAKTAAESAVARLTEETRSLTQRLDQTEKRLQEVEKQMLAANQEADELARAKSAAERKAQAAEDQAAGFYVRLHDALEQVAEIRETDRGLVVNLPDVLFASGSSRLQGSAKEVLSRIAGVLMVAPEYHLSIEGHTDSTGRSAFNQKLSERRAATVLNYLVDCGISQAMMSMRGFGETDPIYSNKNAAGRKKNRRVEIIIEGLTR